MSPTRITLRLLRLRFLQQLVRVFGAQQSRFIDDPYCLLLWACCYRDVTMQQAGDGVALDVGFFAQRVRSLGTRRVAGDFISLLFGELGNQLQTVGFTGSCHPLPCDELVGRCRRRFYGLPLPFCQR